MPWRPRRPRLLGDARVERVIICTPDKDLAQCVRGTRIVQMNRRTRTIRDEAGVVAKFGVPPASIPDYLALVGDAADGYPGLPGWGAKSAAAVLARYGHLESIPADWRTWHVNAASPGRARRHAGSRARPCLPVSRRSRRFAPTSRCSIPSTICSGRARRLHSRRCAPGSTPRSAKNPVPREGLSAGAWRRAGWTEQRISQPQGRDGRGRGRGRLRHPLGILTAREWSRARSAVCLPRRDDTPRRTANTSSWVPAPAEAHWRAILAATGYGASAPTHDRRPERRFNGRRDDVRHVAFQAECHGPMIVVLAGTSVDDDVRRAPLGGQQRNRGRRIDRKRGSQRQHQIGLDSGGGRSFQIRRAQRLAKADGRRLEHATTGAARRTSRRFEAREVGRRVTRCVAPLAFNKEIRAVQLDEQAR